MLSRLTLIPAACAAATLLASAGTMASSHREAPFITGMPKVDGTDFYMFNSYESGREGYVTLIANYLPLQDAYGGPNYFSLDDDAIYEIHIDNDGNAEENVSSCPNFSMRLIRESMSLTLDSMLSVGSHHGIFLQGPVSLRQGLTSRGTSGGDGSLSPLH